MDKVKKAIDKEIESIACSEINQQNVDTLGKLIDMKKDIADSEYYDTVREAMEMRYYDDDDMYGARRRDSRGRYMEGRDGMRGSMPRRGGYGHHMPMEYFDRMMDGYEDYTEGMERYHRSGNYGDHDTGMESLEYMLDGIVGFVEHLQNNMETPEEVELIKKYVKKIKDM